MSQLKFEGKIHHSSKVVACTRNCTTFFKFQGQFDLEGQGHQFSNPSEIFRCLMNSLFVKGKFQMDQFKVQKYGLEG